MTHGEIIDSMVSASHTSDEQSIELASVLDEYLSALESGEVPDREWIVSQHPALADVLIECLPKLAALHLATPGIDAKELESFQAHFFDNSTIGDYRVIREIGRGGMGVVYEAEQLSLERRVAVKVLPSTVVLDPKRIVRFENEAQAAAALDHPNIVAIHGVGCERGVHYYAMQYIEGQSLAQVIYDLKAHHKKTANQSQRSRGSEVQPTSDDPTIESQLATDNVVRATPHALSKDDTAPIAALSTEREHRPHEYFRRIACLGIQAAEALFHAHELGIIHRDVKPSNLLVSADGHLWVTDFGLALTRTRDDLTATGDLVGTIRYMSPEQAMGRKSVLDHRTDIYSLGVVLFELLTLAPAVPEDERHEALQRIVESPRPKPSLFVPRIPRDLETIVMKAMAKESIDRYTSMDELANDLRRFVDGQPVLARRVPARERVLRWSWRHRTALLLVVAVLGLTAVLLTGLMFREMKLRRQAEDNQRIARNAIFDMVDAQAAESFLKKPELQQLRLKMIDIAIKHHAEVADSIDNVQVRFETAQLLLRRADETWFRGAGSEADCRAALAIVKDLVREYPSTMVYHRALIPIHKTLGRICETSFRFTEAAEHYAKCVRGVEMLNSDDPERTHLIPLAQYLRFLGYGLSGSGKGRQGVIYLHRSHDALEKTAIRGNSSHACRRQLYCTKWGLGLLLTKAGRFVEAQRWADDASVQSDRLIAEARANRLPQLSLYKVNKLEVLVSKGDIAYQLCQPNAAEDYLKAAIDELEEMRGEFPQNLWFPRLLGKAHFYRGEACVMTKDYEKAEESFRRSWQEFKAAGTLADTYQAALAQCRLAELVYRRGPMKEAKESFREAVEVFRHFAEQYPNEPFANCRLVIQLTLCPDPAFRDSSSAMEIAQRVFPSNDTRYCRYAALVQYRNGQWADAKQSIRQSMAMRPDGDVCDFSLMAMVCHQMNEKSEASKWLNRALDAYEIKSPVMYGELGVLGVESLLAEARRQIIAEDKREL